MWERSPCAGRHLPFREGIRTPVRSCALLATIACICLTCAAERIPLTPKQLEADWLLQERDLRPISTKDDALSALDGVKDGGWAFHTGLDNPPWWQVDLGEAVALDHALVFNRCDGAASRMDRIVVLLSDDGKAWRRVYQHDGPTFYGAHTGPPLKVDLTGQTARFLRLTVPGQAFLHLDEVEVYPAAEPERNIALWKEADQSSISQWSSRAVRPGEDAPVYLLERVLERGQKLAADLASAGVDTSRAAELLREVAAKAPDATGEARGDLWRLARHTVREMAFRNPLLSFDSILFAKQVPGSFSHMSDQYYGWWSRPGGGLFILSGWKTGEPVERCLTSSFPEGSFMRPELSWDGKRILFAYCRYYPHVAGLPDKQNKENVPEDAFYHVFEMNVDGTGVRQLTHGRYDDFDARYLPSGEIIFLSTRRGQKTQASAANAMATLNATLPDAYVRCGGDAYRPVAVYTLHLMDRDGGNVRPLSPFENFEWTPSIASDGRILYARWDYIDRNNMPYMGLWSMNPDGTNPRMVYGNFTHSPHCVFEARPIPGSHKLIFTASAHHAITGGSLVLLDPLQGFDGPEPLTRLTPEVCFPEIEGWPETYYTNPFPLSETYYLTAWSTECVARQGTSGPNNSIGLYLFDAFGNLELINRDSEISCMYPIPLRPRQMPQVIAGPVDWTGGEGRFVLLDVYEGLGDVPRGTVKALRVVAVPPKTQPNMNTPNLGVTSDDPGKCVLGTVPVESDGSASFRVPSGISVFFQALDEQGLAIQTMRTVSCVQPGQTLSCVGCHEPRNSAPGVRRAAAPAREPSRLRPGPAGSWPLRYDELVQPVLDRRCIRCHNPQSKSEAAAAFDLSGAGSYERMLRWGKPSLADHVAQRYREGSSKVNAGAAQTSPMLAMLREGHHGVKLEQDEWDRLITWMDTYGQRLGSFSPEQEQDLRDLRVAVADLLAE